LMELSLMEPSRATEARLALACAVLADLPRVCMAT